MTQSFRLPDLGEGIHEGEVTAVYVKAGQKIKEGDILLAMETDKATVDIPSPYTGTVAEVRVRPGDTVKVGAVLVTIEAADSAAGEIASRGETEAPAGKSNESRPAERQPPAKGRHETPVPA
ncbi:biotin/lipoyl-containing protein, partial [Desulfosarcina cetonica]|uniref:biotin/lipoyl-containing protein n=1 Tax=Desulfosarcina cetonica TaxID=90730 RepID=UPI000A737828